MKYHKFISPENMNPPPFYSLALIKGQIPNIALSFHKESSGINPSYFPRETKGAFRLKKISLFFLYYGFAELFQKNILGEEGANQGRWAGNPIS